MKVRKKPVVVEAELFRLPSSGVHAIPEGVRAAPCPCATTAANYWIETLEGHHHVSDGDWIITGVLGEKYPCKPDAFIKTYEPVFDED